MYKTLSISLYSWW